MGRSDSALRGYYESHVHPRGSVALLGFTEPNFFTGDCYDIQLGNWDINSDWELEKKYDTIISLRCPYFAQDPELFIEKCYDGLNSGGTLYADWGLGDHWRFKDYKIGWVKNGEHEHCYGKENYLWSGIWDDRFLTDEQFRLFSQRVKKFGYDDIKDAVYKEIPKILDLTFIEKYFTISYELLALWEDLPQLYILIKANKND